MQDFMQKSDDGNKYGNGKHTEMVVVHGKHGDFMRRQTVGRKKQETKDRQVKNEETQQKKNTAVTDIAANTGDKVDFRIKDDAGERMMTGGKVVASGKIGITAEKNGVRYHVPHEDVKKVVSHADGTIPAESFSASDYKKQFTDPKCTNDKDGIEYVYSLLGKDGAETQAMVEKKQNEQAHRLKNGDTRIKNMHNIVYDENGNCPCGAKEEVENLGKNITLYKQVLYL